MRMFHRRRGPQQPVVLLIDGESNSFAPTFAAGAAAAGRTLHVLSSDPHAIVRYSRFCARFHLHDGRDILSAIRRIADTEDLAVMVACSDAGMRTLAEHRGALEEFAAVMGTPHVAGLDLARDKAKLAEYLEAARLPGPAAVAIRGGCLSRAKLPAFPALLKPAFGTAGRGIRYIESVAELERIFRERGFSGTDWVLQSYIAGTDVDVSMLCRDGRILAHTEQTAFAPATGGFGPNYSIRLIHDRTAFEVARRTVRALRWTGFAHMDLRRDARTGRVLVIEINGRFWATAHGSIAAGVNFAELAIRDAQGESFPSPAYADRKWVQLSLARRTHWADVGLRDLQIVRHLKDPGPMIAWRMFRKREEEEIAKAVRAPNAVYRKPEVA